MKTFFVLFSGELLVNFVVYDLVSQDQIVSYPFFRDIVILVIRVHLHN